jgi:hypothetical protein
VCVFVTAGPSTKLFAWVGGGMWEDMCYENDEPRPVCVFVSSAGKIDR